MPLCYTSKQCFQSISLPTVQVAYHDNQLVFEEVLNDVADLIQISNIDRIVFGGDFNTALSRRASTHTRSLNQFVTNESLSFLSALSCYEVDYTHESDAHGTRSTLDHFIVSSQLLVQNGSRSTVSRSFSKLCDVTQKSRHHIVESVCHPTALFEISNDHEEIAGLIRDLLALRAELKLNQNLNAHDIEFSIQELCTA
ncbi:hypothetical protein CAPTEDRAFT_196508 [Capitella teleta]|uniref:Endonuclease/exonuclease/phosphatase domain-containing protein n=1 Tax=Capitella teleta TaxID=283909 RepID=R7V3J4_CAPTE|nr:hypothetical protein CAPTEDRAFT_196508 [Capitella teleta]|eukprot:ELU13418.1 hypothetical protein CAPTEDRAFT_196508 [Capitella teleta]